MSKLGSILLLLSAPFWFLSGCEMYVLTPLRGPQLLGLSRAHSGHPLVILLLPVSAISFVLLGVYSLILFTFTLRPMPMTGHERCLARLFIVQAVHGALFLLYDNWSPMFSRGF